jgi:hypothetical protein
MIFWGLCNEAGDEPKAKVAKKVMLVSSVMFGKATCIVACCLLWFQPLNHQTTCRPQFLCMNIFYTHSQEDPIDFTDPAFLSTSNPWWFK